MSRKLPDFEVLSNLYPGAGYTADQVKRLIGGDINSTDVNNTCVVRLSRSLNGAGQPIPPWSEPFRTRRGTDKRWYGLRVKEFWTYLTHNYGRPTVTSASPIDKSKFSGIRGIIGFRVSTFKDASGHFTLWDGEKLLYGGDEHDYFAIATEAALWEAGSTRTISGGF